jgi:Acyclic terpene utilisation family protein AtuA
MTTRTEPLRVANCSGYWGDRRSAAREMVDGGHIDFLTGDYLAELTMMILWKTRQRRPGEGYARSFLTQMEDVLGTCMDKGIKVVANAGGLNPAGLAADLRQVAERLGLRPTIAHIEGDDVIERLPEWLSDGVPLRNLDSGTALSDLTVKPLTANVYLGAQGIVRALDAGADIVVCPRVTDASVVVGPAAWAFDWATDDYDALAGAVVAGHILECGTQATGGNYAFFEEIENPILPGFPLAEIHSDGSSVITKHPGTPGQVSVGTVTAQLLYEIDHPAYLNPDVTARFDTVKIEQQGPDRVLLHSQRGAPPPNTLKLCLNYPGGYRNSYTSFVTGLDIEAKAAFAVASIFAAVGGAERFDTTDVRLVRTDHPDARSDVESAARLTVTVKDSNPDLVGPEFAAAVNGIGLAIFPGNYNLVVSPKATEYGVLWPTLVSAELVTQRVVLDGTQLVELPGGPVGATDLTTRPEVEPLPPSGRLWDEEPTERLPLGLVVGGRSGDKGGNANLGLWCRDDESYDWMRWFLVPERVQELLPEAAELEVLRYELPHLRAVNVVVRGILGEGVAATTRPDAQAKSLAEFLRSRVVDIPTVLIGKPAVRA